MLLLLYTHLLTQPEIVPLLSIALTLQFTFSFEIIPQYYFHNDTNVAAKYKYVVFWILNKISLLYSGGIKWVNGFINVSQMFIEL